MIPLMRCVRSSGQKFAEGFVLPTCYPRTQAHHPDGPTGLVALSDCTSYRIHYKAC